MLAVHRAERVLDVEVRERRGPVGGLPAHLVLLARLRRLEATGLRQRDRTVSERPDHRVGVVADDVARSGTGPPSSSARPSLVGDPRPVQLDVGVAARQDLLAP